MISLIAHAGAVPFGYTNEMSDCEFQCFPYDDSAITCDGMEWMSDRASSAGVPPLPDLITSNTPPPSPLRRSYSYHFLFPEKGAATSRGRRPPMGPLPRARHAPERCVPSSEQERLSTSLKHLQEVKERVRGDARFLSLQGSLPQLSWEVPREDEASRVEAEVEEEEWEDGEEEEEKERGRDDGREEETEEKRLWRNVGRDLRKLGDQFALKHSQSLGAKPQNKAYVNFAVPLTFTRCLSASIVCLVWWRFLNKLR